jgi:hypothetical protein
MRQFFTWGFWLSLVALAGITFGLMAFTDALDSDDGDAVGPAEVAPDAERNIDLIAMVFAAQADPGFDIVDGRTTADMQIRIDGFRFMNIKAGTPGENRCATLDQLATCTVAADLLGESVLWFSIVPLGPRNTVVLPAVSELLEGSRLRLANGWVVQRADVVKRVCDEDTASLTDFIRRFGDDATSTFSLDEQQLVSVSCGVPTG